MEHMNPELLLEVAEIQLSYKSNVKASERPRVTSPEKAYEVFLQSWDIPELNL